ncbi:MAG: choice-of-anchor A family protein [Ignavibacteria bacterium]
MRLFLILFITCNLVPGQTTYRNLGTWTSSGVPNYLTTPGDVITPDLLSRIYTTLPEYIAVNPAYIATSTEPDIVLLKESDVYVTFISEGAGYRSALGFYTYTVGNTPVKASDIGNTMTIIFPNVSAVGSGGGLNPGDKVKIGRFPANTIIGWFVLTNGWNGTSITDGIARLFSDTQFNPETDPNLRRHNVLFNDQGTGKVILGFEDMKRDAGSDNDFNDVLFSVSTNPADATDKGNLPSLADPKPNSIRGLIWEDKNKNGIRDNNEPGLANVDVKLYNEFGMLVATKTTDTTGQYKFNTITGGNYYLFSELPASYQYSLKNQGSDTQTDSDFDPGTMKTSIFNLNGNVNLSNIDGGGYIRQADLVIEEKADKQTAKSGDQITYSVKVTNQGPGQSDGIVVTDQIPAGLKNINGAASQGNYNSGIWNIGSLNNGDSATLTLSANLDPAGLNGTSIDLGVAKDFNLFVIEDLNQLGSDTEGKVAVGHNAILSNYSIGDKLTSPSGDVLIVGNDLTFISGAIYNGNAVYWHSTNLPKTSVSISNGELRNDNPINFSSAKAYLEGLSANTLTGYSTNGTTTFQWGCITLTGSDAYLNVFSVRGSDLSAANNFEVYVPNGSVVLVNIDGTNVSWSGGLTVNGTARNNVLYNFYQARNLKIQGIDATGTILAPTAALSFPSGVVNGQVIVKSMTGNGQFSLSPYEGNIPLNVIVTNSVSVTSSTYDQNTENNASSVSVTVTNSISSTNDSSNSNLTNVSSFTPGETIFTIFADGNDMYAGTLGGRIYKSTDQGNTWGLFNSEIKSSYIWSLIKFKNNLYAATEKGVYKLDGISAISLDGRDVHALATDGITLYAGTWGYGVFKSVDGSSWQELENTTLGGFTAVQAMTVKGSDLFVGTVGGGIFKCTDGSVFTKTSCNYSVIWSLASNSNDIYTGTYGDGLYKSSDGGNSFSKVKSLNVSFIYSVSAYGENIYVSSLINGVFISTDNGSSWASFGLGGYGISSFVAIPNSSGIYAGTKDGKLLKISGAFEETGVNTNSSVPVVCKLEQNYPNPFNPSTRIKFSVQEGGMYSLKVYNAIGQEIVSLLSKYMVPGNYEVTFDAGRLTSGLYIYKLTGANINLAKKMLLMK